MLGMNLQYGRFYFPTWDMLEGSHHIGRRQTADKVTEINCNDSHFMEDLILFLNKTMKNWTLDDYMELTRGPKYLPIVIVLPITIIYVIIFFTGIIGNTLVCWVIIKHKMMHSATNYYLFSLAVSDLMLLILGLPNDLSVYWQQYPWQFGESFCKIRALASEMSSYTSVLTIVAFTMERYIAICHPLYAYTMSSLARVLKIILAVWLVSFICALPFAAYTTVNYIDYPPSSGNILEESAFCAMLEANIPQRLPIYELSCLLFFIIPIIIIVILYSKIAIKLRERNDYSLGTRVEGSVHSKKSHSKSRKPIIRMLVAVVSMFFICWAPFHAQRLLYLYGQSWPNFVTLNEWMYYITGALYFFSSTVNPILYNLMSAKYRKAFKQTLSWGGGGNKRGQQSSLRESSQEAPEMVEKIHKNVTKRTSNEIVKNDTIVRVNNRNPTNGNYVLTVTTGFFPKNLFILSPNPVTDKEQGKNSLKDIAPSLCVTNHNTGKETYI